MAQTEKYSGYGLGDDDDEEDDIAQPKRRPLLGLVPRQIHLLVFLVLAGAFLGLVVSAFFSQFANQRFGELQVSGGLRTGATIGLLFWFYFALVEPAGVGKFLKRRSFVVASLLREGIFFGLILVGLTINRFVFVLTGGAPGWPAYFIDGGLFRDAVLALILSIGVFFILDVARMIGPRVLTKVILGQYHQPVTEERLFLFLDVRGATALAQRLGDEETHEFLTRFFADIDKIMLRWRGEVVTYLGDGVLITWPFQEAIDKSAPLEFLADVMAWIVKSAPDYKAEFGAIPTFRAGFHGGDVVAGECGESKREIAYIGDVVNVAARLEQACKETGFVAMASAQTVRAMRPPDGMVIDELGPIKLKGRQRELEVAGIRVLRTRTNG